MKSRKVKIIVFYRNLYTENATTNLYTCENATTLKERYTTTFILDECYLLEFLPSLIREDVESVEAQDYVE